MADPGNIAFGRGEIAYARCSSSLYAALAWFAPNTQEIMGYDHKNRTVGENPGAWRLRPLLIYASAAVLAFGILEFSDTANSSISGSESTDRPGQNLLKLLCAAAAIVLLAVALNFLSIPCSCSGPRGCLRRCIRRTPACRMPG